MLGCGDTKRSWGAAECGTGAALLGANWGASWLAPWRRVPTGQWLEGCSGDKLEGCCSVGLIGSMVVIVSSFKKFDFIC